MSSLFSWVRPVPRVKVCRGPRSIDSSDRSIPSTSARSLSSGEGLIYDVRVAVVGKEAIKDRGKVIGYQDVIVDHGVADKRLLVVETEFGGVLKVLAREGNKLSAVMRQGWDGVMLASMTKSFPYRATDAHISLIGHITVDELTKLLTHCDQANGFANRMLWVCCRRSKLLPFGGQVSQLALDQLQSKLSDAVAFSKNVTTVCRSRDAMDRWAQEYPRLTRSRPGVLGMVTSRREAHALRLATLYSLMDRCDTIELAHLNAALALWDYCERSASYIFGKSLGDRDEWHEVTRNRNRQTRIDKSRPPWDKDW